MNVFDVFHQIGALSECYPAVADERPFPGMCPQMVKKLVETVIKSAAAVSELTVEQAEECFLLSICNKFIYDILVASRNGLAKLDDCWVKVLSQDNPHFPGRLYSLILLQDFSHELHSEELIHVLVASLALLLSGENIVFQLFQGHVLINELRALNW